MIIHDMFTDFCIIDKLNLDLTSMSEYCYYKETQDKGNLLSNVGGWQSNDIKHDSYDVLENLKNEILIRVKTLANHIGVHKDLQYEVQNMWININRKNNYNKIHDHPGSIFAGTFYVKCFDNCGKLTFYAPQVKGWCMSSLIHETFTSYNSQTYSITPEENNLILFLSSTQHGVEPNLSNDDRISISFNVGIKYA